jgi:hypothetical protein
VVPVTAREEICVAALYHTVTLPLTDACYRLARGSLEAVDYDLEAATAVWRQALLAPDTPEPLTGLLKDILAAVLNTVVWEAAGADEKGDV